MSDRATNAAHEPPDARPAPAPVDPAPPSSHDSGAFSVASASPSDDDLHIAGAAAPRVAPPDVAPPAARPSADESLSIPRVADQHRTVALPRAALASSPPASQSPRAADQPAALATAPSATAPAAAASESPITAFLLTYSNWRRAVALSARKLEFPAACACCMRPADAAYEARYVRTSGVRVVRSQGYAWSFPYCKACLRHLNKAEWIKTASIAVGGSVGVLVLLALLAQGWIVAGLILAAVIGVLSWYGSRRWLFARLTRRAWADCACLGPAVRYDDFHGTIHRFSFASRNYAAAFERANAKKIVDPGA